MHGDHRIYYEVHGDGPRMLLFNGSGATVDKSALLISVFAKHFTIAVHDQRGLGRSDVPVGPYTMAEYAADGAAVLDECGWNSCLVVGISFGGMVAQEFAVTWPKRVQKLALLCTSPGGALGASYPLHELAELSPTDRAEIYPTLLDSRFTPDWLQHHPTDAALVADIAVRRTTSPSPEQMRGEREQLLARSHHDVGARLGGVTASTFVAAGRFDGIAPLVNSEAIAALIPDATLHVYEGGHMFMAQDKMALPDIFNFLSQTSTEVTA
ncbi:MAG: alpha/beta fold hydrolase [Ilumatobacteraceae bacterium]|nr:alpha/beta fold hydrolase [Ilumatobacteraceae bacterium]